MKKRWIILSCCIILLVGSSGYIITFSQSVNNKEIIMSFTIYPISIRGKSYYFVLNSDRVLNCSVGVRKSNKIRQSNFLKETHDSSEILLDEYVFQTLIDLANQLEVTGLSEEIREVLESWEMALFYKGIIYERNWDINDSEVFGELAEKIIELSPLPVDLHGWL